MADLKRLFGEEWYQLLKPIIDNGLVSDIAKKINGYRTNHVVIPPKGAPTMFRAFRETPYSKVKVIILGQDPYHSYEGDIPVFDGLAFSNGNTYHASPSLRNIIKELEDSMSDGLDLKLSTKQDLTSWAMQGVLLINTAHSVLKGQPGSHLHLWKEFTEYVLKKLNEKNDLIWLLWGQKSINYKQYITNRSHTVICTSHPSPFSANNTVGEYPAFIGSNCFNEANEELDARNISKIVW
jgi:uracil-DNA glycosylase